MSSGKQVCEACGQPASFRCPKCSKLGLPDSYFCSDKCFRGFWNIHKVKHNPDMIKAALELQKEAKACADVDERFAGYIFTGKLRNGKVSPRREVPSAIPRPDYAETGNPASEIAAQNDMPPVQGPEQIAGMRAACAVAREVLDIAAQAVRPGVTTDEIDKIVHEATIARGAYPSPLNYYGFPKSVCTSVNEVICHGIPDSRKLEEGDIVNIDVTVYYKGYHGDVNETYPVGKIDEESKKLIQAAYDSMMKGIQICKPGVHFEQIGNVIGDYVHRLGFTADRHYCGHGIGT